MSDETILQREDTVDAKSIEYLEQAPSWVMYHDLLGGTLSMREAGQRWLPREEKELDSAWTARLNRTFLYNGFANTVDRLTAKPFSKPVTRQGEVSQELASIELDVDKAGTTLTNLVRAAFRSALVYGRSHVLVDFTQVPEGATKADEKQLKARPTMVLVEAPSLIGWRYETTANSLELTQIRIHECRIEPDGEFLDKKVEYIREFTKTDWRLFVSNGKDKSNKTIWTLLSSGKHSFGAVPFFTYYTIKVGFMCGKCPLEDLAWINLRHWQSSSEQNSVLRIARVGILFGSGFSDDEISKGIVIGPNHMVLSENTGAKLEYVEHQGNAIKAGQDDLDKLETRMEVLGLKPLVERTSNSTYGGKLVDEMSTHANVQSWVRGLEWFIKDCMAASAKWLNQTLAPEVKYDVYSDFGLAAADAVHLDSLLQACLGGKISDQTFLEEYKRRAVLSESLDVKTELAVLKAAADAKAKEALALQEAGKSAAKQPGPVQ